MQDQAKSPKNQKYGTFYHPPVINVRKLTEQIKNINENQILEEKKKIVEKIKQENYMSKQVYRQYLLKNIIEVKKRRNRNGYQKFSQPDIQQAFKIGSFMSESFRSSYG